MALSVRPISLAEANAYVATYHRHHPRALSWKFGIAVEDPQHQLRGVIMVSRPVARSLDDGWTLEVIRCCTDGTKNAPSLLYSAAWRAARTLGYCRMVTYTLASEPGTSLRVGKQPATPKDDPPDRGGTPDRVDRTVPSRDWINNAGNRGRVAPPPAHRCRLPDPLPPTHSPTRHSGDE